MRDHHEREQRQRTAHGVCLLQSVRLNIARIDFVPDEDYPERQRQWMVDLILLESFLYSLITDRTTAPGITSRAFKTLAVPVTVIANATNRGFPAAINQVVRGEFLVLLNNDVVVTEGWLGQLVALASVEGGTTEGGIPKSKIGLVGPMSNYAAPPQLVEDVPYRDLDEMQGFARGWREEHRGKWFTVRKLSGFCLLMTRDVYQAVGGLDERFGLGFFDDDDLAERARRAGFELAVAYDLFVHHFGSRTFVGNGVDAAQVLDENAKRFAAKWGDSVPQGRRVALRGFSAGTAIGFTNGRRSGETNGAKAVAPKWVEADDAAANRQAKA